MTSLTWIKRITGIGLSLMTPEAQRERMDSVFEGDTINGPALAQLIDECKTATGVFLEEHGSPDAGIIREVLARTDGKQIVANIGSEEDIAWLLELKEKVYSPGIHPEDLKTL